MSDVSDEAGLETQSLGGEASDAKLSMGPLPPLPAIQAVDTMKG